MVAAHDCRHKEQEVPQERTHHNGRERRPEAQPRNEECSRKHHQKPRAQASPQDEEVQKPELALPLRHGFYAPIRRPSQHVLLLSLKRWGRLDKRAGTRPTRRVPDSPTLPYAGASRVRFEGLAETSPASQRRAHPQPYVVVMAMIALLLDRRNGK